MGAGARIAALCGLVMLVAPGTLAGAMYSWAEPLVRLWVVLVVVLALRFDVDDDARSLALFVVLSGAAPMLHGRLVTLTFSSLLLLVLWWRSGRIAGRRFLLMTTVIVALYTSGRAFAFVLRRWLYRNRMTQESRLLGLLTDRTHVTDLVREVAGQGWYLVASTAGLALVGFVVCVTRSRRAIGRDARPGDRVALHVAVLSVLMLLVGSLQLVEASRGDQFVYGRYVETVAPLLFVAGVVAIGTRTRAAARAMVAGVAGVLVVPVIMTVVLRQDIVAQWVRLNGPLRSPNVPALDAMQSLIGGAGLVRFAVAFGLTSVVVLVVARRSVESMLALLAVALLASSSWTMLRTMDVRYDNWRGVGETSSLVPRSRSVTVGYDDRTPSDKRYYVLRYELHPVQLVWMPVSGPGAVVPDRVACVYGYRDHPPSTGEWVVVGTERSIQRVLWRRTSAPHC